jgi:hypothetical protein
LKGQELAGGGLPDMKLKALVVDDNGRNLVLEKDLLEVAGFEVFVT